MPSFRTGVVAAISSERAGLQRVEVDHGGQRRRAYVLTRLIGDVAVGDRVVVNTTAVELGLGTGGWDVVHWNLSRTEWDAPGSGHVMKLRYTSLQADTGVAEEAEGYTPGSLTGVPVVACALHSQVGVVAAAFKDQAPDRRLVYVMTDTAALPLALSDLVADLRARALVDATVSAGQAFGGDHEAVNVASALEVATGVCQADAIVVAAGPGVVGTGTVHGFSALEVAGIVDMSVALGATPIVAVRWSDADARPRHRGVSHHTTAALELAAGPALIPVPRGYDVDGALGGDDRAHDRVVVEVPDIGALLASHDLNVTTMGRGPGDEPGFFAFAGAAGVLAGRLSVAP